MELELGLKITRTRDGGDDDDHCGTSISELQIAKDRAGPLFLSKETNAMFILTAHLKGYKRKNIEIKISEDGKEISISGEKPIQEMLMIGWVMMKNQVEILGFKKVFKIPNGVVLDWIKAKYNEDESILKIVMPKVMKRIYGVQIEEVIMGEEYGESSQKDSEVGGNESILEKEQGLSNKKLLEASNGEIIVDTSQRGTKKHRFEIGDGFEAMRNLELGNEEDQHSQKKLKEPINQIQPLKDKDVMLVGEIGGTNAKEIETKYRDEKGKEINKEEEQEKTIQGGEYESFLARQIGVNGEEIVEETKQRETKVPKSIETRDRDGECMVGKEPSMKEEEAIEQIPLGESKKVVGEEMSKEGVAEIGTEMKKKVPKALNLFREHENVSARERENGCSEEDMNREKKQKQFEQPEFKTKDKDIESLVGENICKEGIEEEEIGMKEQVSKAPTLLGESNNVFVRAIGSNGDRDGEGVVEEETCKEGVEEKGTKMNEKVPKASSLSLNMNGETKQKESEKPESETEDKNRENVVREEISKEAIQGTEPEIEEQVSKDPTLLRESRNLFARELIWSNGEDMNREKKQKDIKEPMFETKIRDRESMVDEEIEIEEPKFEIEDKDGESVVGGEICKEAIEGTELGIEEKVSKAPPLLRESRNTFAREIGSNGEDMNRETKQKENKEPMLETKIRDRESMVDEETCREGVEEIETRMKEKVPEEKQAEEPMFESEDKNRESEVGEEITKEGLKGTKIEMKEQVSKAPVGLSNGETEENKIEDPEFETKHTDRESVVEEETCKEALNGETEQKENEEPKFETKGMDRESNTREEISKEVSEDIKVEMKEQVPKAPNQLGESKIVFAKSLGLSREDFDGETKQKEREEPKCEEKDKEKEWIVEDTGMKGFIENEHSERTIENMEGEEDINGVAKQRETEESEIPKSTKAKVVVMEETKGAEEVKEKVHKKTNDEGSKITQRDYTKEAEQMATNIAKFPEHMVETKAKREGEVKVKGEVVTKMHDEAKVGVHKDITRERVHMEIGQPSVYEVKGDNNGKSQVEASGGFKKDNTRETNQEETEEPHVGTKHKDKKCIQEEGALTNIREGPKDTETEKMENGESLMKEEIQEKNVETLCKKEQNTKDLKDQSLEGKGFFKTLIQNRGQQYMLENSDEKGFETKRDSNEEEKVSQKDQAEIVPFKSKGTRIIAESEDEEEPEIHGKTQELKGVEEFKEALDNSEMQNPQKELVLPQMEIQREEGIPFHASEISNSEVAPAKAIDTHSEATRINFGKDAELKGDVDKPSIEKSEVDEKGKIDECCEGVDLEFQEKEKQESNMDFQESTKRRFDQEVEKVRSAQEEEEKEKVDYEEAEKIRILQQEQEQQEQEQEEQEEEDEDEEEAKKIRILQQEQHEEKEEESGGGGGRRDEFEVENTQLEEEEEEEEDKVDYEEEAEKIRSLQQQQQQQEEEKVDYEEEAEKTRSLQQQQQQEEEEVDYEEAEKIRILQQEQQQQQQDEEEAKKIRILQQEEKEEESGGGRRDEFEVENTQPEEEEEEEKEEEEEEEKEDYEKEAEKIRILQQEEKEYKVDYEEEAEKIRSLQQEEEEKVDYEEEAEKIRILQQQKQEEEEVDYEEAEKTRILQQQEQQEEEKEDEEAKKIRFLQQEEKEEESGGGGRRDEFEVENTQPEEEEEEEEEEKEAEKIRILQQQEEEEDKVDYEEEAEKIRSLQQEEEEVDYEDEAEKIRILQQQQEKEDEEEAKKIRILQQEQEEKEEESREGGGRDEFEVENTQPEEEEEVEVKVDVKNTQEEEDDEVEVENTQELEMFQDIEVEKREDKKKEGDEVEVENTQELEVLENIEVEESEDKKNVSTPIFIAGSAFLASLIVLFVCHKRVGKR